MLVQARETVPCQLRDYPEWHRGRKDYAVWLVRLEDSIVKKEVDAARQHLSDLLVTPYPRQPHVTLFVCGFLSKIHRFDDDFHESEAELQAQMLRAARLPKFSLTVGALNSFKSAAFFEIHDPYGGLEKARRIISFTVQEIAREKYTPHVTVGLYSGAFPSKVVLDRLSTFSMAPIHVEIQELTLATYRAQELGGRLSYRASVALNEV